MRRVLATLLTALALPLASCQSDAGASAPRGSELTQALPTAKELPGSGWTVIGTTERAPDPGPERNPLAEAQGASPECRAAINALQPPAAPTSGTTGFARGVYRSETATSARDLNLTLESGPDVGARAGQITAMTKACTSQLRTQAGNQEVTMRIRGASDGVPGAVGYTVTYDTAGLVDAFDLILLTRGNVTVSASITGPNSARNRAVLTPAATKAAAKLDAVRAG